MLNDEHGLYIGIDGNCKTNLCETISFLDAFPPSIYLPFSCLDDMSVMGSQNDHTHATYHRRE